MKQVQKGPVSVTSRLMHGPLGAAPGRAGTWPWVLSDASFGDRKRGCFTVVAIVKWREFRRTQNPFWESGP